MSWTIGRPINGITINGLAYACDEDGKPLAFESYDEAEMFCHLYGITEDDLEDGSVVIVEEEDE